MITEIMTDEQIEQEVLRRLRNDDVQIWGDISLWVEEYEIVHERFKVLMRKGIFEERSVENIIQINYVIGITDIIGFITFRMNTDFWQEWPLTFDGLFVPEQQKVGKMIRHLFETVAKQRVLWQQEGRRNDYIGNLIKQAGIPLSAYPGIFNKLFSSIGEQNFNAQRFVAQIPRAPQGYYRVAVINFAEIFSDELAGFVEGFRELMLANDSDEDAIMESGCRLGIRPEDIRKYIKWRNDNEALLDDASVGNILPVLRISEFNGNKILDNIYCRMQVRIDDDIETYEQTINGVAVVCDNSESRYTFEFYDPDNGQEFSILNLFRSGATAEGLQFLEQRVLVFEKRVEDNRYYDSIDKIKHGGEYIVAARKPVNHTNTIETWKRQNRDYWRPVQAANAGDSWDFIVMTIHTPIIGEEKLNWEQDSVSISCLKGIKVKNGRGVYYAFALPRIKIDGLTENDVVTCNGANVACDSGVFDIPEQDTELYLIEVRRHGSVKKSKEIYVEHEVASMLKVSSGMNRYGEFANDGILCKGLYVNRQYFDYNFLKYVSDRNRVYSFLGRNPSEYFELDESCQKFPGWTPAWVVYRQGNDRLNIKYLLQRGPDGNYVECIPMINIDETDTFDKRWFNKLQTCSNRNIKNGNLNKMQNGLLDIYRTAAENFLEVMTNEALD